MKAQDTTERRLLIPEDQVRKTIILLRWILIIVVGYLIVFSHPDRPLHYLPYGLFLFYLLTNFLLILCPRRWFEKDVFIFPVLLVDIAMSSLAIYITARMESEFYLIYFLLLFIASFTRKAKFLYFSAGLLMISYAGYSYFKTPSFFVEPVFLLRFSFLFVVTFFFNLMIEAYNRVRQEKDLLKEDYMELEILSELAQSIGQNKNLADFLVRLNQTLCQKLQIERCTSILVDKKGREARICFGDDRPEDDLTVIDLLKTPSFKASIQKDMEEMNGESPSSRKAISRYILKQIPLSFNEKRIGTLYLRVNTPLPRLTHRENFFLDRLARIMASAIHNLDLSSQFNRELAHE